jgi:hypothetical protein
MTSSFDSQNFESYVPVYDAVPDKWEDARPFIVEQLKKISTGVNVRTIGFYLDEELLSGNQFIPGVAALTPPIQAQPQFRQIFRKVIDFSPMTPGANSRAHDIVFDANFTLIEIYGAATNTGALTADPITFASPAMDVTNVNVTSAGSYNRAFVVIHYLLEQ